MKIKRIPVGQLYANCYIIETENKNAVAVDAGGDFERLKKIHSLISIPLVMHGGSGVSHEDYRKVIGLGIRKINYYTYMAKAGGEAVDKMTDRTFFHDIEVTAQKAMHEDVKEAIKVFQNKFMIMYNSYTNYCLK